MLTKLTQAAANLTVSAEAVRQPPTAPPAHSDVLFEGRA
jgi:hypothetical protein